MRPEVLSILKLGSKETLTLEVAPGYREWLSSLTENGGDSLSVKFRGRFDPLVKINSFSMARIGTFLYQKYL
jgi:hypothetical protein